MRIGKNSTLLKLFLKVLFLYVLFVLPKVVSAQYDYEHYIPPFYNGSSQSSDIGYHQAILSTNSISDVKVDIYKGYSEKIGSVTIKLGHPAHYDLPISGRTTGGKGRMINYPYNYNFPWNVVGAKELNTVLPNQGLRFFSSNAPFFVNIRHSTDIHGGSLTSKGTYAYGTEFLSGHLYTHRLAVKHMRSHFISVMATEDNTQVNFTDVKVSRLTKYNATTKRLESIPMLPTNVITVTLDRGESYVIGMDHELPGLIDADRNAMNGTSVTSSKPIVMNTGSWTSGGYSGQDIGIDQIVPISEVRNEYILMRGQGNINTERPIIVATEDNTKVEVNGVYHGTIAKKGGFMILSDPYDLHHNVYILADKNIYVYQTLSGSSISNAIEATVGMNFIAPVSTSGIREVTVPYSNVLATRSVSGVITILAQSGSVISYSKGSDLYLRDISEISLEPTKIPGVPQWEIYRITENLSGSYHFYSNKAINVAWLVRSGYVGAAGYYSGFTKEISKIVPDLDLDVDIDLICESYDDQINVKVNDPLPDFYEWYKNDFTEGPIIENGPLLVDAPNVETTYYVVGSYRDPLMDQLFNGSFFERTVDSDYREVSGNLQLPGHYSVVRQSTEAHPSFKYPAFTDLDNDLMFMAISDQFGDTIYRGTSIDVVSGFNYIVKLHGRSVVNSEYTQAQSIKVMVNNDIVIDNFTIDNINDWQTVTALWKPGTASNAIVKLLNNNPSGIRSAFALDSITFVQAVQDTTEFVARVIPNYSYGNNGTNKHFCKERRDFLDISNGDTSWYTYSWSKKNGEDYTNISDGSTFTGTKTHKLVFLNPQNADEGEYRCVIGFKPEYEQCGTSESSVNVNLTVYVDELATVDILTDKTNFCSGDNTRLTASVRGDSGELKWFVNGGSSPVSLENPYVFNYPAGTYTVRCEVENGCGLVFDEVIINVLAAPTLNSLTVNDNLCESQPIVLTADAVGEGVLTYKWRRDAVVLTETGSVLNYPATLNDRDANFTVKVTSIYTIGDETIRCPNSTGLSVQNLDIFPMVVFNEPLIGGIICEGSNHSFNTSLKHSAYPYTYQWIKDDVELEGNFSSYNLSVVDPVEDSGRYKVKVLGRCNSEVSEADLSVTPKIKVNGFDLDKTGTFCIATDITASFEVVNNGATYIYQVIDPTGVTTTITNPYTFTLDATNEGKWEFLVSSTCDAPVSFTSNLNMHEDFGTLTIADVGACIGETITLEASVLDIPAASELHYVWTDNLGNPIGTDSDQLEIVNVQDTNFGTYTVLVTDQCGNEKTASASLTKEAIISPTVPMDLSVCEGDSFSTTLSYVGSPSFEWRFNDPLNGTIVSTTESLYIASTVLEDAGIYYCKVHLVCGTDVIIQRRLIVNSHISIEGPLLEEFDVCDNENPVLELNVNGTPSDYQIEWRDGSGVLLGTELLLELDAKAAAPIAYAYTATVTGLCETIVKTYKIKVHDKVELTPVDPISACEGDISFSVDVIGTDYTGVEWWNEDESEKLHDGLDYTLFGATHPDSEGRYIVKVISDYCTEVKTDVLVSLYEPITIVSTSNLNPVLCSGEPLSLVVNSEGDGIEYKWYANSSSDVILSTSNLLHLGVADSGDIGSYTCEVNSSYGCLPQLVKFDVDVKEHVHITSQPEDVSICASDSPADFTVSAIGEGVLTYSWYDKTDNLVGGNSSTLSIVDPSVNIDQYYYCRVSSAYCDSDDSDRANLIVREEVTILNHPTDVTIAERGVANFTVLATGAPVITYQWEEQINGSSTWQPIANGSGLDGAIITGSTSATLSLSNISKADYDLNEYRCIVNNSCTPQTSDAALLQIDLNASIDIQPQNIDACVGDTGKSLNLTANVGTDFYWEYRENGGDLFEDVINGGMENGSITLDLNTITLDMVNWSFRCTVSNGVTQPDVSDIVKVNVFRPITSNSVDDLIICNGSGANFEAVNVIGSGPYHYTWKRESVAIGSNSHLTLSAAAAVDANYFLQIDNGVCPAFVDDFAISHYEDLSLESWDNISKVCIGTSGSLNVSIDHVDPAFSGTLNYAWRKSGNSTIIGTDASYELPLVSINETGLYNVAVSDGCSEEVLSGFLNVYDFITKDDSWQATDILCLGSSLILEAKVTGDNLSYSWTVPNSARGSIGDVPSIQFHNLTFADSGTYKCIVTGECGTVTYTTDITILEAPEIISGIEDLPAVCEGDQLVLGPIVVEGTHDSPVWILNDDVTTVITTAYEFDLGTAELSEAGNYKVTVSNICGSDVSNGSQVVNSPPDLESIASQEVCGGDDVIFRANATGANINYQWLVDGVDKMVNSSELILSGAEVSPLDFFTEKVYAIECKVTTDCGDISTSTSMTVQPQTILNASLSNVDRYVGESYTMSVDVTGVDLVFKWTHEKLDGSADEILPETGNEVVLTDISMADAGYYTCRITGVCGQRLASGKLVVKEPVVIDVELNSLEEKCVGDPLNLAIVATGQISSITWYKDDILIPNENELNLFIPVLDLSDAGEYKCVIIGEGTSGIIQTSAVRVYSQTVLNTSLVDQELCENEMLDWLPDVEGTSAQSFKWFFEGDEIFSGRVLHYPTVTLDHEGEYEVQVTSLCGDVSSSANLEVIELPAFVSATTDQEVCENLQMLEFSVEFTGDNLKYQWLKDGVELSGKTTQTLRLLFIQIDDAGDYSCKVSSTCGEIISPAAHLSVTPQLRILSELPDLEVCRGEDVEFVADVEGVNVAYQWKRDGIDLDLSTYPEANSAILHLSDVTSSDNGYYSCAVSDDCTPLRTTQPRELLVHELPNTAIYGRMKLCVKEDRVTYVTIDQPDLTYNWDVTGGIFAGLEEGVRTRITWGELPDGNISIMLNNTLTGCQSQVDSAVVLNALPTVNLINFESKGVCEGEFELAGGFPEGGIYWVNGISQTVFNPYDRGEGSYEVYYSYTDENNCSNITPIDYLQVEALPVVNITDDITIGSCTPTLLEAETNEDNIQWFKIQDNNRVSPLDLDDANSFTPTFTPGESQVLLASVQDEHACEGVDLLNLTVAPLPVVTTINDITVGQCNQLVLLTDIVGDQDVISWTNPDHLDHSDVRSPKIINAPAGTHNYKISVTDLYGCDATDEVNVSIVADPQLGEDKLGCEGDSFEVNLSSLENPFWSNSDWSNSERERINALDVYNVELVGRYSLKVSNAFDCMDEQLFVINPLPDLGLKDTLLFEGQTVIFEPNLPMEFGPYFFEWEDGSILQRKEVSEAGEYTLKVVDNIGCTTIDKSVVTVKPIGIESPNAFLPFGDDDNNRFYLKEINAIEKFEMYIYDRWGELLFKTNEVGRDGGWNGYYKGKLCPTGSYVWVAFINGELTNKGTFVLVR